MANNAKLDRALAYLRERNIYCLDKGNKLIYNPPKHKPPQMTVVQWGSSQSGSKGSKQR